MISVIIPCFNCGLYITDTINSILNQSFQNFEIIVIDDGSTDNTAIKVKEIKDDRVQYFFQQNKGVSKARNNGLSRAKRKYVVFFDGDDLMSDTFLEFRVNFLERNPDYGFCCGIIETFPLRKEGLYGAASEVAKDLLLYNPYTASCPSNYLIRKDVLTAHNLRFNESLSSTADRFFLLQLANKARGKLIEGGKLLYRITGNSMSNNLTRKLIDDNELFLAEIKRYGLIPEELKGDFLFKINYILGLSYLKKRVWSKGIKYTGQALVKQPIHFMVKIFS
jgi:hypothetical protein